MLAAWFSLLALVAPPDPGVSEEREAPEPESAGASDDDATAVLPDTREPPPPRSWQAEIFVDLLYTVNSNSPDNHVFRSVVTSPRSGELSPNAIGAFVRHKATDSEPWWFELGLHAGPAVDALVEQSEPLPGGANSHYAGIEVFKHIALANTGVRVRKSRTSLGAGVFESPFGLSSFWTMRNHTYTPMWHNHIVPYYFMGARIAQELPGGVTLFGWLVNGAQTYADRNKAPSGVFSINVSPAPRKGMKALSFNSHVLFGPERASIAAADWLILWDTTLAWDFDSHFSMGFVWDYTIENPGRPKSEQNMYTGGGLLVRGTVVDTDGVRLDLVVRPDAVWDRDGRFLGVPQWLIAGSLTANLWLFEHLVFRVEYRFDQSTNSDGFFYRGAATADDGPGLASRQHSVLFTLTALWDFWFGRQGPD